MYLYPLNVHAHIMLCELVVKLRLEVCRLLAVGCQDVSAFKTIANVWFVYTSVCSLLPGNQILIRKYLARRGVVVSGGWSNGSGWQQTTK